MDAQDFLVARDDYRRTQLVPAPGAALEVADGQVLLRVDDFALTANNVTYAVAGDMLNYWAFFPAPDGWGRIPVWGFGEVIESRVEGLREGERFYGYYPMSTHLRVEPRSVSPAGFVDASTHRASMALAYNQYRNVAADPGYTADGEAAQMLLYPLFLTAFLIDDFLAEADFFGARSVLLSSASSKTAFATAFQLSQREGISVIGLTSPRNMEFCRSLGCYDEVVAYAEIASLPPDVPGAYVDMAGNGAVTAAVHRHLGERLGYSGTVGMTHWEQLGEQEMLPGPEPALFFAPSQIEKRAADWGGAALQERIGKAFQVFRGLSDRVLEVSHGGRGDLDRVYHEMLEGQTPPSVGHVLSLNRP